MHPIKTHCKWQNKDIAPTLGKLNSPNHEVYCAVIFVTTINCFIELLCWSKQSKERFTLQRASRFQIESALNVYDFPPSLSLSLPILVFLVTLKPSLSQAQKVPQKIRSRSPGLYIPYTGPSNTQFWNMKKQSYFVEIKSKR